ncbi:hypothetical protein DRN58_04625 [Thermococci archaeon]|nr:MAG: hypothetical protein DRN58_04625 [Thermococci archaeon]
MWIVARSREKLQRIVYLRGGDLSVIVSEVNYIFMIESKIVIRLKSFSILVLVMKKPIVTGDTPAIREFFRDRENSLLCEIANPDAIADAILELKDNPELREKIAKNGYKLFKEKFSIKGIGKNTTNSS